MSRRVWMLVGACLLVAACGAANASTPVAPTTATVATASSSTSTAPASSTSTTLRPPSTTTTIRPATTTTSSTSTTSTDAPRPTTTMPRPTTTAAPRPTSTTAATTTTTTTTPSPPIVTTGPLVPLDTLPPPLPPPIPPPVLDPGSAQLDTLTAAIHFLTPENQAISVSVWRDGVKIYGTATGFGVSGQPVTTDTPLVLASVSKLVTMLTVARLAEAGLLDLDAPVPWEAMGLAHHPWWEDVTARELLRHSAGMPVAQNSWLNQPGSCAVPLAEAMIEPPRIYRGQWVYSNGNYCALGLLIEHVTFQRIDDAARTWVLDRLGITGPHLTVEGLLPGDGPYALDVRRLDRLGGAGIWIASSDDVAMLLTGVTDSDRALLTYPGIMTDQYGWGHSGTIDGAKGCAWVMEGGRTIVVAIVAGNRPSTGGRLCDAVVPALADDLGFYDGLPLRLP